MPPSAEAPLRLIQVGAGSMGRAWLHTIGESPDAVLVGLVDLDSEVARRAAADTGHAGVVVGGSLDELIDRVPADAVVNVTVPAAHKAVSILALRNGLPVLCEKPLAETVGTGLSMVAAAELTDRLLMVSQSRRYWRQLDTLKALVARLGAVGSLQCSFRKAPRFGGFREQMPYPLLIDMAIHQFDLARVLIPSDPVAVYCDSYNPTWSWYRGDAAAEVSFEFVDGSRFSFTGSWCAPGLETSWNGSWRVSAAGGTAIWDGDHEPMAQDADGHHVTAPVGTGAEQIAGSLAEFVAAVREGRGTPAGEVHGNILSLAMVEASIRSAQDKRRVTLAEILDDAYRQAVEQEEAADIRAVLESWPSVHEVVGGRPELPVP